MSTATQVHQVSAVKETKRDAFLRLAEKRTNAVLERIRVLSNCANPYAYEYGEEDVRKIFSAIDKELKAARTKFDQSNRRKFTLT
jgi:hypothetical protein